MENKNTGFTGLASLFQQKRKDEPTKQLPKPQGPKQKRVEPNDVQRQPLSEVSLPLPERLEVNLKLGKHPKTGAPQWLGYYDHGKQRLKVVCDPRHDELPQEGEVWEVRVKREIPGIVFAQAVELASKKAAFAQAEHVVLIESIKRHKESGYGGPQLLWIVKASLPGIDIPVVMELPQAQEPPRPGETWRVRNTSSRYASFKIAAEPIERLVRENGQFETELEYGNIDEWRDWCWHDVRSNQTVVVVEPKGFHPSDADVWSWLVEPLREAEDGVLEVRVLGPSGVNLSWPIDGLVVTLEPSYGKGRVGWWQHAWQVVCEDDSDMVGEEEIWRTRVVSADWSSQTIFVEPIAPVIDDSTESRLAEVLVGGSELSVSYNHPDDEFSEEARFPSVRLTIARPSGSEPLFWRQEDGQGYGVRLEYFTRDFSPQVLELQDVRLVDGTLKGFQSKYDDWDCREVLVEAEINVRRIGPIK